MKNKFEILNPNSRNPKEIRNPNAENNLCPTPKKAILDQHSPAALSTFGFRTSFGFRISDFGFREKFFLVFFSTVIAAALAGCASGGAYEARNATKYDLENRDVFVLMDAGAQRSITSSGIQQRVTPDGRLEVTANIRNRESRRVQVQVNCVFKDEQGFSTGDETPWQNLILTENSQEAVHFISMNDKARRYTIRVREAR